MDEVWLNYESGLFESHVQFYYLEQNHATAAPLRTTAILACERNLRQTSQVTNQLSWKSVNAFYANREAWILSWIRSRFSSQNTRSAIIRPPWQRMFVEAMPKTSVRGACVNIEGNQLPKETKSIHRCAGVPATGAEQQIRSGGRIGSLRPFLEVTN